MEESKAVEKTHKKLKKIKEKAIEDASKPPEKELAERNFKRLVFNREI